MAYQALYRKWRPRTFDSIVGQTAITSTLKNAIKRNTISHAFLFSGPRGTGKTSCAKIFAKALNCINLQDGEPCNECQNCQAADKGSMPDIIEIDAASNNGVDEIRDIRDKVKYAPTQGKYKVYIIDEVHMLSIGAFNALLKTLEEPPEHVVFILATTELQKVPATIISRTQRYNFKRIHKIDLEKRMEFILDQEKISYEKNAISVIAQVADGGMRDALSILDQLLSYEKEKINYQDALKITGFAAKENIEKILLALLKQDTQTALNKAQQVIADGASSKNILDELINLATNSLLVSKARYEENTNNFLTENYVKEIQNIPIQFYFRLIKLANNALTDLRYTNQQQIPLEVFLVEASHQASASEENKMAGNNTNLQAEISVLKQELRNLTQKVNTITEKSVATGNHILNLNTEHVSKKETKSKRVLKRAIKSSDEKNNLNRKEVYRVLKNATQQDLDKIKSVWPDLQSVLEVSERALLDVLVPVAASPQQVVMKCKYALWFENASSDSDLLAKLTGYIEKFTKHSYGIVLVPDNDWLAVRKEFVQTYQRELLAKKKQKIQEKVVTKSTNDSKIIKKAKDLFGDTVKVKD